MSLEERLKKRIQINHDTGCHEWTGCKNNKGYGLIALTKPRGRAVTVHRASYEFAFGPIPEGQCVLHKCDNPCCVNPEHLFLGSHRDNVADKVKKGRQARGETLHTAKLTEDQVRYIRAAFSSGRTQLDIAEEFDVPHYHIHQIVKGKTWKHVCH